MWHLSHYLLTYDISLISQNKFSSPTRVGNQDVQTCCTCYIPDLRNTCACTGHKNAQRFQPFALLKQNAKVANRIYAEQQRVDKAKNQGFAGCKPKKKYSELKPLPRYQNLRRDSCRPQTEVNCDGLRLGRTSLAGSGNILIVREAWLPDQGNCTQVHLQLWVAWSMPMFRPSCGSDGGDASNALVAEALVLALPGEFRFGYSR